MQPTTQFQRFLIRWPGPWHISLIFKRLLVRRIKSLEYDPHAQYRFHQMFAILWLTCMAAVIFVPSFRHSVLSLLIFEASLYANFDTDFGSMSSALAAGNYHCKGCRCNEHADF